jgi:hypothetical protein
MRIHRVVFRESASNLTTRGLNLATGILFARAQANAVVALTSSSFASRSAVTSRNLCLVFVAILVWRWLRCLFERSLP